MRNYSFALAGLCAVILGIGLFAFWSARTTSDAAANSAAASRLAGQYHDAHDAVAAEESLERKYRLEPGPGVRNRYNAAAVSFVAALGRVRALGSAHDREFADRLLVQQQRYLRAVHSLFAAVDAHQTARVLRIDTGEVDPTFGSIHQQVARAAEAGSAVAAFELHSLQTSERDVLIGTGISVALGLLLLAFFTRMLVAVNRQLRTNALQNEHNALHDELTDLPNRRLLFNRLEQLIAISSRDPRPFSLMLIDLDRFKDINDTLGHHTGDLLLQAIGPRLQPLLRPGDTLARIGGDEFVVLLPAAGTASARLVARRVLTTLREPLALPGFVATVDCSIGIVTHPTHGEDAETLVQRADIAMYLAKSRQTGEAVYDPENDPYDPRRLALVSELREAIASRAIDVHYQPTFDGRTLRPVGVEALARWQHPVRGPIAPDEFIPLAEHTGQNMALTEHVLRRAVCQWRLWREQGRDLPVSVNLSVANLLDAGLVSTVQQILQEERVPPQSLRLELTESTIMCDPERAERVLLDLAAMGIGLSVDDFGTGYSSLAYLRRLPVTELKIDRSFISQMSVDDEDAAIVRATIQLAHDLGLTVVAEGIEDARTLRRIQELGCDGVQGFHLCRPQAAEAVSAALDQMAAAAGAAAVVRGLHGGQVPRRPGKRPSPVGPRVLTGRARVR